MPRRAARSSLPPLHSALLALLALAWSAAVIDERLLGASLPGPGQAVRFLPYAMPALLAAVVVLRRRLPSRLEEATIIWVILVLMAALLLPSVARGSLTPLALPAVALAAPLTRRWPIHTLFLVALMSASFGSLQAFWHFPVEKVTALLLAGLWASSLAALLFRGSRPVRPSLGMLLLGIYLLVTAIMVPLADDRHVAGLGFKDSAWFMFVVPLVAYAGWPQLTLQRIAKAVIVVSLAAGGYAIYRVIAGPATQEFQLMASTPFNFVNGKLKPGGSFGSAQSMGTWMAAVVPFCFAGMLTLRGRWQALSVAACGVCIVALLESQLRIGLIGIILGLLLVLVIYAGSRGFPGIRLGTTLAAALVGAALVSGGLSFSGGHGTHTFSALLHPTSDASFKARQYKWSQALDDLQTHPFGYGVGTASFAEQIGTHLYFAAGDTNVDNGFLRVALEQGLVIMAVFALALLAILLALIHGGLTQTDRIRAGLVAGAAGTLGSFLVVMMAEDATYNLRSLATWMIVGIGMAVVVDRRPSADPAV